MTRVAEINAFNFGSTGKIMLNIAKMANENNMLVKVFCPDARMTRRNLNSNTVLFGNILERRGCERIARLAPLHDRLIYFGTKDLLTKLDEFKPDILHFHNLHGDYVNLNMLFKYAKKYGIKIVWTFHDCWPFTGHCPYFTYVNCNKWRTQCFKCPQYKEYPVTYIDDSKALFSMKKKIFTSIEDIVIVTPSEWLNDLVKQSFLSKYKSLVINNGIELDKFKPVDSDILRKLGIENKHIILAVAYLWDRRKGLDRILKIAQKIDQLYHIIVVGSLENKINCSNVTFIPRTSNLQELIELYSCADVLINPTYEDNFPTVNIEALACGTPVLTYNTGGAAEMIDSTCGEVIDDSNSIDVIKKWCSKKKPIDACIQRAKRYDAEIKFKEYIELYKQLMEH